MGMPADLRDDVIVLADSAPFCRPEDSQATWSFLQYLKIVYVCTHLYTGCFCTTHGTVRVHLGFCLMALISLHFLSAL